MTATDPTGTDEATLPWHLRDNRAPIYDEVTLTELEVKGSIPPELEGRYVRNGANPQTGFSEHWFVGDGMVHGEGALASSNRTPRAARASSVGVVGRSYP